MAKGQETDLDPAQSYRSAMKELIGARWGAVWNAVPVAIAGEDIEGVHQVRVASRRLRAAMDVAVGCFADSWYRPLHKVAKEITGALGEVRDRDVLLEFLERDRDAAAPGEKPGINRLIDRVDRERDLAREWMLAFLTQLESKDIVGETIRRFGPAAAGKESSNGRAPQ
jgi:CHAD domain-containing protein